MFALVDHTGRARTEQDFRGRMLLVYFGFTHCPDVCPTDLAAMAGAVEALGVNGNAVQPLFITLDPDRDTVAVLGEYVPLFHPRLTGLTGSAAAIDRAAAAYKVWYEHRATDRGGYTIDHSGFIYLVDREGDYVGFFPPGTTGDRMAAVLLQHFPRPEVP